MGVKTTGTGEKKPTAAKDKKPKRGLRERFFRVYPRIQKRDEENSMVQQGRYCSQHASGAGRYRCIQRRYQHTRLFVFVRAACAWQTDPDRRAMSDINELGSGMNCMLAHTYAGYENKVKTNLEKIIEKSRFAPSDKRYSHPRRKDGRRGRDKRRRRPDHKRG